MAAAIANSDSDSYSPKRLMPLLAAHRAVLGAVAVLGHRSALEAVVDPSYQLWGNLCLSG